MRAPAPDPQIPVDNADAAACATQNRTMDPLAELSRRGGVARTATLVSVGVSAHALRRAKEAGAVRGIRRGWVALPDADPLLVGAASRGVVLSCITAAARHGLWVPDATPLHVAARPNASRLAVPEGVVVHWAEPLVARHPDAVIDGIVNTLSLVAACQPEETALVVWGSALNRGVVDREQLRQFDLPPSARGLLERVRPFADSGLETIFVFRLRWLKVAMVPQAWVLGHRVDVLIGERLVIQIDGASHTGAQRTRDIAHDAQLLLRGYHVLRFSYDQVMNGWPQVQALVMEAVAKGRHRG